MARGMWRSPLHRLQIDFGFTLSLLFCHQSAWPVVWLSQAERCHRHDGIDRCCRARRWGAASCHAIMSNDSNPSFGGMQDLYGVPCSISLDSSMCCSKPFLTPGPVNNVPGMLWVHLELAFGISMLSCEHAARDMMSFSIMPRCCGWWLSNRVWQDAILPTCHLQHPDGVAIIAL